MNGRSRRVAAARRRRNGVCGAPPVSPPEAIRFRPRLKVQSFFDGLQGVQYLHAVAQGDAWT